MMAFLMAILILSTFLLAVSSWMRGLFYISALQAWMIAGIAFIWRLKGLQIHDVMFIAGHGVIKGVLLPWFAIRLCHRVQVYRDDSPVVSDNLALLLVLGFVVIAFSSTQVLPQALATFPTVFLPPALVLLMTGFLIWVNRHMALASLLAYLVITNGVTLALAALSMQSWLVEMIFLTGSTLVALSMGVFIPYLKQEFDHIDTRPLKGGQP
jgi:hydrogenase-4 membrane subunit HyfE